ncbi:protein of unknown function (plasmid) [Caballeronia sp. S22]
MITAHSGVGIPQRRPSLLPTCVRSCPSHSFCTRAIASSKLAVNSFSVIPSAAHHSRTSIKSRRRCPLSHLLTNGWSTLSLAASSLCRMPADSLASRRLARKRPYCCVYIDFSTVGPSWHEVNSLQSKIAYAKIAYAIFAYCLFYMNIVSRCDVDDSSSADRPCAPKSNDCSWLLVDPKTFCRPI